MKIKFKLLLSSQGLFFLYIYNYYYFLFNKLYFIIEKRFCFSKNKLHELKREVLTKKKYLFFIIVFVFHVNVFFNIILKNKFLKAFRDNASALYYFIF